MFGSLGVGELGIIALIALLLFGAGRISDLGKGLGQGIRQFKNGLKDDPEPDAPAAASAALADAKKS